MRSCTQCFIAYDNNLLLALTRVNRLFAPENSVIACARIRSGDEQFVRYAIRAEIRTILSYSLDVVTVYNILSRPKKRNSTIFNQQYYANI